MADNHVIYLARLDYEQDGFAVAAVRAVRHIWNELGIDHKFAEAKLQVDALINAPEHMVPIAQSPDLGTLVALVESAAEYHGGAAEFVVDPESTTVEIPTVEDGDDDHEEMAGVFSPAAFRTAMLLVNMSDSPMAAVMHALALARATEDPSLYAEVVEAIAFVFELPVTIGAADDGGAALNIYGEGNPDQVDEP